MGILNVTPDSFSDGGMFLDREEAVGHACRMADAGAHIIDVGGESTRPGSLPVSPAEQMDRVLPVIEELADRVDVTISVDTTSSSVAESALASGAHMVNDVSALSDPRMAGIASESGAPLVLMHMQGTPRTMQKAPGYVDVMSEVYSFLEERVDRAVGEGMSRGSVIVDPGIGFGKRLEDNLLLISRVGEFRWIGCRVLLGHSRKSFLGALTGTGEPIEREAGTHAVTALSSEGADIFRVHDVEGARQVLQVARSLGCSKC
jgi:dihydropteroate synthase